MRSGRDLRPPPPPDLWMRERMNASYSFSGVRLPRYALPYSATIIDSSMVVLPAPLRPPTSTIGLSGPTDRSSRLRPAYAP